jgi:hypothetical protein
VSRGSDQKMESVSCDMVKALRCNRCLVMVNLVFGAGGPAGEEKPLNPPSKSRVSHDHDITR